MAITRAQQAKQMLQDGGRIGFKGGADMGTVSTPTRTATAKSVSVSPSGGVTTSTTRGPDPVERPGTRYDPEKEDLLPGDVFDETIDLPKDDPRRIREENKDLFINKPGNYPKYIPPSVKFLANLNRQPNRRFFYEKVLKNNLQGFNYTELEQAYKDYMSKRMSGETDAFGNPIPQRDDNNDQPLVATNLNPFKDTDTDTDTQTEQDDFSRFFRLMADGGRVEDMEREAMFIGGIVKGIKKAVRGVKKIAKSPIGKLAISALLFKGAGGFKGLGALKGKLLGEASIAGVPDFVSGKGTMGILGKLGLTEGGGSLALTGLGKFAAVGVPAALAGAMTDEQKDKFKQPDYPDFNMQAYLNDPYKYTPTRQLSEGGSEDLSKDPNYKGWVKLYEVNPDIAAMNEKHSEYLNFYESSKNEKADGGIMRLGYQEGSKEPVAKKTMPLLDMDGKEMDFREEGGFVPIGRMEKADDVPARLSKNEFVFTADAVRNAGDGDVDKGAEVMYNMMKNLESGGDVSEESQGLEGARKMFQTSKRLEEVL